MKHRILVALTIIYALFGMFALSSGKGAIHEMEGLMVIGYAGIFIGLLIIAEVIKDGMT